MTSPSAGMRTRSRTPASDAPPACTTLTSGRCARKTSRTGDVSEARLVGEREHVAHSLAHQAADPTVPVRGRHDADSSAQERLLDLRRQRNRAQSTTPQELGIGHRAMNADVARAEQGAGPLGFREDGASAR
jgi:hypothetical protein